MASDQKPANNVFSSCNIRYRNFNNEVREPRNGFQEYISEEMGLAVTWIMLEQCKRPVNHIFPTRTPRHSFARKQSYGIDRHNHSAINVFLNRDLEGKRKDTTRVL